MPSERTPPANSSWMSRPLEWLTRAAIRFPLVTLAVAGALLGGSVWLTVTRMGFRTSRAELLSPRSDYNRRWLQYTKEFSDKEDVVVVVEGESREQIVPALDDFVGKLTARSDLFTAVMHETDAPKLRSKGLYYLKLEELHQIDGFLNQASPILQGDWSQLNLGGMARWMGAEMAGGPPARRQKILAALQTELPRVMQGIAAALTQPDSYKSPWPDMTFSVSAADESAPTRLISDNGRMGFILLRLKEEDRQSFAQNQESIDALHQLIAEVGPKYPGLKIGLTGLPIIEYDEMQSSQSSMSLATLISFLGVLAVMIVAFGGFRHAILAMAALVVAMIWACGYITLAVGYVNILSIAFASILFGLGIDYGIYYVARYLQQRANTASTSQALVETAILTGPGILTGAVTSAIAFFAAWLTEFPGVAQLGVIAGGGVMLCWLAEAVVLPAMIRLADADGIRENLPAPLNLRFWLAPLFAYPRLTLLTTVALTAVAGLGMHYLRYDYNLLHLQPVGLESIELEHKLFDSTNRSAWFALSMADTKEEVAAKKEQFLRLPSVERGGRSGHETACRRRRKNVPTIERIHQRLANLPRQVPEIPVTPHADLDQMLAAAQRCSRRSRPLARPPPDCNNCATCCGRFPPTNTTAASTNISKRWPAICSRGCTSSRTCRPPVRRSWPTCPSLSPRASSVAPAAT